MSRSAKLFVGNTPPRVYERDLERVFDRYGRIRDINIKDGYAFIEYSDPRDAEDALDRLDGYDMDGWRLRIERSYDSGGKGRSDRNKGERAPPPSGSKYWVAVDHLPKSASWQDLKDHMRKAGSVDYVSVSGDGRGEVAFGKQEDADYAVSKLDDSEFKDRFGNRERITVTMGRSSGGGGSDRRSRDDDYDRDRDRRRDRDSDRARDRDRRRDDDDRGRRRDESPARRKDDDDRRRDDSSPHRKDGDEDDDERGEDDEDKGRRRYHDDDREERDE